MTHFEKTIDSTRIYEGRILNLRRDTVELENGKITEYNGDYTYYRAKKAIAEEEETFNNDTENGGITITF